MKWSWRTQTGLANNWKKLLQLKMSYLLPKIEGAMMKSLNWVTIKHMNGMEILYQKLWRIVLKRAKEYYWKWFSVIYLIAQNLY